MTNSRISPNPPGHWHVESDEGLIPVSQQYNNVVECALRRNASTTSVTRGRFRYDIRFDRSDPNSLAFQKNLVTDRVRSLRRIPKSAYVWEFHEGDTFDDVVGTFLPRYATCAHSDVIDWEYERGAPFVVVVSPWRQELKINFRDMNQVNLDSCRVRALRRRRRDAEHNNDNDRQPLSSPSPPQSPSFNEAPSGDGTIWNRITSTTSMIDDSHCAICLVEKKPSSEHIVVLRGCDPRCPHSYHRECLLPLLRQQSSHAIRCPVCTLPSGHTEITGAQPPGDMTVSTLPPGHVGGLHQGMGAIQIIYDFPNGVQGEEHAHPGLPYTGTTRVAYLPDCEEGREVLRLLGVAWRRKLIFTVGTSVTTGMTNCVVWSGIHHKTSLNGGVFGYPDDGYLRRVKAELADRGVA